MSETKQITFTYQEIAELLVKKEGIHDGLWGVYSASAVPAELAGASIVPAAIVLINKIGLIKFDQPSSLTVDASKVNPISAGNS